MTLVLDMVEHYAIDLGWWAHPLAPESKRPATQHGYKDATRDLGTIRSWWRREPRYGVGIACGGDGPVIVDVDVKDGKPGIASLCALEAEHGVLPRTMRARTPSGGLHPYYAAIPGRDVRRAIGVRPGIDLLGTGGYACAPPTTTPEGQYTWIDDDDGLAALPAWVADLARPIPEITAVRSASLTRRTCAPRWDDLESRAKRAIAYVDAIPPAVSGHGGHDQTFRVALALVRGFELPRSVAAEILNYYNQACDPPWSERELEHKLDHAERASVSPGYLLEARP